MNAAKARENLDAAVREQLEAAVSTRVHFDRGDVSRCGKRQVSLSADRDAVTCLTCLNLLDGTHSVGNRKADPELCGTAAAYRRHYRHGERPCESCIQGESRRKDSDAIRERRRARYREARAAGASVREANRRKDLRRAA